MLPSTVQQKHNINIHDYAPLVRMLKNLNKGYKPKKAMTLSAKQMKEFILEAADDQYLDDKVVEEIECY